MWRYGFELEGFWCPSYGKDPEIPLKDMPTDGFPGIVEVRTSGGKELTAAYTQLLQGVWNLEKYDGWVDFHRFNRWKFSPEQRRELRKRPWNKAQVDVQNIYSKKPRDLGKEVMISFQINISYIHTEGHNKEITVGDKTQKVWIPDQYTMIDIPLIIKRLDHTFKDAIKTANRQTGEYCIKNGNRLEYRSLPAFVFQDSRKGVPMLLNRIKKAVETTEEI